MNRIDRGVNVLEGDALSAMALEHGLGFIVCPVSNACVTGDTKARQVARMLETGLRVTVNSDDPAYFGRQMIENPVTTEREAGLGAEGQMQLARNAIETAWLPRRSRDALLEGLARYRAAADSAPA